MELKKLIWLSVLTSLSTFFMTDYILCTSSLAKERLFAASVLADVCGSDHCPVSATFHSCDDCYISPPYPPPPPLCASYFVKKQDTLKSYLSSSANSSSAGEGVVNIVNVHSANGSSCNNERIGEGEMNSMKRKATSQGGSIGIVKKGSNSGNGPNGAKQMKLSCFFVKNTTTQRTEESGRDTSIDTSSSTISGLSCVTTGLKPMPENGGSENGLAAEGGGGVLTYQNSSSVSSSPTTTSTSKITMQKFLQAFKAEPPPLCPKHKKPSVERVVKISGPNEGCLLYN